MSDLTPYQALESRFHRMSVLGEALGVLHWDAAVNMPPGGADSRSEQVATLRVILHEMMSDPGLGDLISEAESADLDAYQSANLHEMGRSWRKANALPEDLVAALSKACSRCENIWRDAKQNGSFSNVQPHLEEVLSLTRDRAAILGELLDRAPYDALIDDFEPGVLSSEIAGIFDIYSAFLPDFLAAVLEKQASEGPKPEAIGPFSVSTQESLIKGLAETVGFDFQAGRMDVSAHPFSTGYPGDQRITVSYSEDDVALAIMAALHESGHAMYEQNLPADWRHQPVGTARGMALHESQSLLIEMQACRSPEFLSFLAPKLRDAFGAQPAFEEDQLIRLYHWVQPDFIRVEADEVTYPAHVILRFRLEQALLSGDLPLSDLPQAWDDGMEALLGVRPPDQARGVLQDIHWYDGAFGYFPTYKMGAMTAAQLFQSARQAIPELGDNLARGDFSALRKWLTQNVHSKGSSLSSAEIVTEATGRALDPSAFTAHLQHRYLGT